jgi:hypothetical protein
MLTAPFTGPGADDLTAEQDRRRRAPGQVGRRATDRSSGGNR